MLTIDTSQAWNAASELGGDQTRYFAAGGSAGGSLSFSIAERLIADGKGSQISGIVALVPATLHHSNVPEEYLSAYTAVNENIENTPVIDRKTMETFYRELLHPHQHLLNINTLQTQSKAILPTLFNSLLRVKIWHLSLRPISLHANSIPFVATEK